MEQIGLATCPINPKNVNYKKLNKNKKLGGDKFENF